MIKQMLNILTRILITGFSILKDISMFFTRTEMPL